MWYNTLIVAMLKSPFHSLISGSVAVVTYTGRKSGKVYQVPANFVQIEDRVLLTSFQKRTWWRSLAGGAEVLIRMRGQDYRATSEIYQSLEDVRRLIGEYLHEIPHLAPRFGVARAEDGALNEADIDALVDGRVMVELHLLE